MHIINSKEIVARVLASYNITHKGWINLSPMWISDGIAEIGVPSLYEPVYEELTLVDGSALLPVKIEMIENVQYRGYYVRVNHSNFNANSFPDSNYNNNITVEFESGYLNTNLTTDDYPVTIVYRKLKTEYDQEMGVEFPLIIDNDYVKQALVWYILRAIMFQGLNIYPLTFDRRMPDINPSIQFEKYSKLAVNDLSFDKLTMIEIHSMSNTAILTHNPSI